MKHLILGTAGHVDHGKTALVRALTGVDTDRLPEEKLRGITIDLGFAKLRIGDLSFGVVDVPGHEDFIRNMLAGATGIDVVLLVVAADEGVMPQTREHLAILDLLDVRGGVVAITKSDLATEEWTELVIDDVHGALLKTSLADAPIVPVSALTGAGLEDLRGVIAQQAARPTSRNCDDAFRMPIDRVFTVHGTGTVITGTVWSGRISVDQTVNILPSTVRARIRGIQIHGEASETAEAGERAAIALSGVDKAAIQRGEVAADGAAWTAARMLTIEARMIADTEWLLRTRQRVRVHVGTTEVLARAVLLVGEALAAGETGWVQLRLETPIVARVGDRLVLRSYSPVTTIGGGVVAEINSRKRSRLNGGDPGSLARIISGSVEDAVQAAVERRRYDGVTIRELVVHTPYPAGSIEQALNNLTTDVVRIGDRWFSQDIFRQTTHDLVSEADRMHVENPLKPYLERAEVRARLRWAAPDLIDAALREAVAEGLLIAKGSTLCRAGFEPELTARQTAQREQVLATLRSSGLAPPTIQELGRAIGAERDIEMIVRLLAHEGLVEAITPDLYLDVAALRSARERTLAELGGMSGLAATAFRATLPVSRKHLIPVLEYFDREGITIRDGDLRSVPRTSDRASR